MPNRSAKNFKLENNMAFLVSWQLLVLRCFSAIVSGLLLSASFSPLEFDLLIWLAMVPLILVRVPARRRWRLALGWLFGFSHFGTCLAWLNQVGFGAGVFLAIYCACYPMLWYYLWSGLLLRLQPKGCDKSLSSANSLLSMVNIKHSLILVVAGAALWVALEWIRSWFGTGFSWNQLGISLWQRPVLLQLTTITGVYGLSFLIMVINISIALFIAYKIMVYKKDPTRLFPRAIFAASLCFALALLPAIFSHKLKEPDGKLKILAVQGNIPQCRSYSKKQLLNALSVYVSHSLANVNLHNPDLIVWPETAVPAPMFRAYEPLLYLSKMFTETKVPLLTGNLHVAQIDGREYDYNSAFLIEPDIFKDLFIGEKLRSKEFYQDTFLPAAHALPHYNKIHRVPFGEYVPFAKHLPWLVKIIGMGRGLSPGQEFKIFNLPQGAMAGVNICYEDVFPLISRQFTMNGANILITLTNDAWYAESSGSRQHMIHAVFRAVENRRPLFRSGNNSDTCLIMPNGKVCELLYDQKNKSRFVRKAGIYEVPFWNKTPLTIYTKWGDWFAIICALFMLAFVIVQLSFWGKHKYYLWQKITRNIDATK